MNPAAQIEKKRVERRWSVNARSERPADSSDAGKEKKSEDVSGVKPIMADMGCGNTVGESRGLRCSDAGIAF